MNPINRVGQKVRCITAKQLWQRGLCPNLDDAPEENKTYTVSGFEETLGQPGIHLLEIPSFSCACAGYENLAWPISAFRPLDERKTDISELKKLALTKKVPEPVR